MKARETCKRVCFNKNVFQQNVLFIQNSLFLQKCSNQKFCSYESVYFFFLKRVFKRWFLFILNSISSKGCSNEKFCSYCDTMRSNSFPFVMTPHRRSLCLFWREIHTKGMRARSPTRPDAKEGMKVPEEDRESQLTKEDRRDQSAWDSSPGKDTVGRRK